MDVAGAARADLARWLIRQRNPDGGWGYRPGHPSRLEPTSWALVAIRGVTHELETDDVFEQWPHIDGVLVEGPSGAINYAFAGLAAVAWLGRDSAAAGTRREAMLHALVRARGVALPHSPELRQDNQLEGWSWTPGTFSWLEPTAWCLLALKRWRRAGGVDADLDSRIEVGDRLLLDRVIDTGGWNYGNAMVYGKVLQAFVPTTALALIALRDRRDAPEVVRGLEWLRRHRLAERSAFALAWAAIGLRACGVNAPDLRDPLIRLIDVVVRRADILGAALIAEGLTSQEREGLLAG